MLPLKFCWCLLLRWMQMHIWIVLFCTNGNVVVVDSRNTVLVYGWTAQPPILRIRPRPTAFTTTTVRSPKTTLYIAKSNDNCSTRRVFSHQLSTIISASTTILLNPLISDAASTSSSTTTTTALTELQQRLPLGHARVKYLLDHWDDITSVCGTSVMSDIERKQVIRTEGGGGNGKDACSKTPLRVQEFMGYKSINDPLYKIDKLLIRVGSSSTNFMSSDDYNDFIDTVEQYRTTADATALLAYTSSWGEANPNGSKEVIDDYLDQTKAQVIISEELLRKMLLYLNIPTLPPLQGKI